jgi:hypothetical protein
VLARGRGFNRSNDAYFDLYADKVAIYGLPGAGRAVDKKVLDRPYRAFRSAFLDVGHASRRDHGHVPSDTKVDLEQITIFTLDDEGRCVPRWVGGTR